MFETRAALVMIVCTSILGGAVMADVGEVYWAEGADDAVRRVDPTSGLADTVLQWPALDDAVAVAVDASNERVYWAQAFGDRIVASDLTGTYVDTVAEWPTVQDAVALAVDSDAGKIYWAERKLFGDRIVRADVDGLNVEVIVAWPDIDGPVGLSLDVTGQTVYWAQSYGDEIRRAGFDGTGVEVVVGWPEVDAPVAVAFDASSSSIFWAERATQADQIRLADSTGQLVQTVVAWPSVDTPVALVLSADGNDIYWAESAADDDRIKRAEAGTGLNVATVVSWPEISDPVALAVTAPTGCAAALVTSAGPRYLEIDSGLGLDTVAFHVAGDATDPTSSCVDGYIQSDGTLGTTAVFQPRDVWGSMTLSGSGIIPSTRYAIRAECGSNVSAVASTPRSATTWRRGDTDNNLTVDFNDIARIVAGFLVEYGTGDPPLTVEMVDLAGYVNERCRINGIIDFIDIAAGIEAFLDHPNDCLEVCP